MRITAEKGLGFSPDEARYLGAIFRGYFPDNHRSLPESEKQEIEALWSKVSDAINFRLFHLADDEAFPSDYPEIDTPNTNNAVGKAIGWAALHMTPGSAFITGWVGEILESDYIGIVPEGAVDEVGVVPRTNDGLAHSMAGSFLEAGQKAQEWTLQLLEASS